MNYVGTVQKVSTREWGSSVLTSWQLGDQNLWFRCEGDATKLISMEQYISFEGPSPNKIDINSIKGITKEDMKETEVKVKKQPPLMRDDYWRWKQQHDLAREDETTYGYARSDAARLVTCALQNDVLDIPKNITKAKRYDLFMGIFRKVTDELYEETKEKMKDE